MSGRSIFHAVEGAVVDLASLTALGGVEDMLLGAMLKLRSTTQQGLVLHGLDLSSDDQLTRRSFEFSPGQVVLRRPDGPLAIVRLPEGIVARPADDKVCVSVLLELGPPTPARPQRVLSALSSLTISARCLTEKETLAWLSAPQGLLLCIRDDDAKQWVWDLDRLCAPGHVLVERWLKVLDKTEKSLWADKMAKGINEQPVDQNRVRYNGCAAVYAARAALLSGPMSSADRLRVLDGLFGQLRSIFPEQASQFQTEFPSWWVLLAGLQGAPALYPHIRRRGQQ